MRKTLEDYIRQAFEGSEYPDAMERFFRGHIEGQTLARKLMREFDIHDTNELKYKLIDYYPVGPNVEQESFLVHIFRDNQQMNVQLPANLLTFYI